jgi:hypothetical protein
MTTTVGNPKVAWKFNVVVYSIRLDQTGRRQDGPSRNSTRYSTHAISQHCKRVVAITVDNSGCAVPHP